MGSPNFSLQLFHITVFTVYVCSEYYNLSFVRLPGALTYGGRFKWLTFINTILQTIFFGYSIVNDLIGTNLKPGDLPSQRSPIQKIRDLFAASIIFPVGCFVVITFWSIYAIDRELVFPKSLDAVVPQWLNHVMHTTVILFLFLEKFCVYHHYPRRRTGLLCTLGFASVYQLWILWIAFHADIWVYPILAFLSWPGRVGFFAACWLAFILLYILGEKITEFMWKSGKMVPKAKKIH